MRVRQEFELSPLLFSMVLREAIQRFSGKIQKLSLEVWIILNVLMFVDYIVILVQSEESVQHNLNILEDKLEKSSC